MMPIDNDPFNLATSMTDSAAYQARRGSLTDHQKGWEADIKVAMAGPHAERRHEGSRRYRFDFMAVVSAALKDQDDRNIMNAAVHHLYLATGRGREAPAENEAKDVTLSGDDLLYLAELTARLCEEAATLVSANWPAIERVAKALITRDLLDQAELDSLISNRPSFAGLLYA